MRAALAAALAITAALAVPQASAAGTPVLDGKKVKSLSIIQESGPAARGVDPTPAQVAACKAPDCARLPFVYKPAKGVSASLSVTERNFYAGLGDADLYLLQGSTVIASCTGTFSNKRHITVPASALKPGATYTAVMFYSHSIGESTSMTVDLPGTKAPEPVVVDASKAFPEYSTTSCGL